MVMYDRNNEMRLLKIDMKAFNILDDISCIMGFAQYYNDHNCLTEEAINDIFNKMNADPFVLLQETARSGDELDGRMYALRTKLAHIPFYNAAQFIWWWRNNPDLMNSITDLSCEEYKLVKAQIAYRKARLLGVA